MKKRLDIIDLDGMKVSDLIEILSEYDDGGRIRIREEFIPGGFGRPGKDVEYIEIGS